MSLGWAVVAAASRRLSRWGRQLPKLESKRASRDCLSAPYTLDSLPFHHPLPSQEEGTVGDGEAEPVTVSVRVSSYTTAMSSSRELDVRRGLVAQRRAFSSKPAPAQGHLGNSKIPEFPLQQLQDDYHIANDDLLGQGGFGVVRRATCKRTRRQVAVKSIYGPATRVDVVQRELKALSSVSHVSGVSPVYRCYVRQQEEDRLRAEGRQRDGGEDTEFVLLAHLVSDIIAGGDLCDHLISHGRLGQEHASRLMKWLSGTLSACENAGVIHLDIKPENLCLGDRQLIRALEGSMRLIDFGHCRPLPSSRDGFAPLCGDQAGSDAYAPPEVLYHDCYHVNSDVWSVAILGFVCMTGGYLWHDGEQEQVCQNERQLRCRLSEQCEKFGIGKQLSSILHDCLACDPADRLCMRDLWKRCVELTYSDAAGVRMHDECFDGMMVRRRIEGLSLSRLRREVSAPYHL